MRAGSCRPPSPLLTSSCPEPFLRGAANGPLQHLPPRCPGLHLPSLGLLQPREWVVCRSNCTQVCAFDLETPGVLPDAVHISCELGFRRFLPPVTPKRLSAAGVGIPVVARPHTVGRWQLKASVMGRCASWERRGHRDAGQRAWGWVLSWRARPPSGSQTAGPWRAHLPVQGICPAFPGCPGVAPAGTETLSTERGQWAIGARGTDALLGDLFL